MEIYIVTHPKFEGWIKLGRSYNPVERLKEYNTGCPERDYILEFRKETDKCKTIEAYFHNNVSGNNYEWFKCSVGYAVDKINEIINDSEYPSMKKKVEIHVYYHYYIGNLQFYNLKELAKHIGRHHGTLSDLFKKRGESFTYKMSRISRKKVSSKNQFKEI